MFGYSKIIYIVNKLYAFCSTVIVPRANKSAYTSLCRSHPKNLELTTPNTRTRLTNYKYATEYALCELFDI